MGYDPCAFPLFHFTVLSSSHVPFFLNFCCCLNKIPRFFGGTTRAEKFLEDHIIQSTQCLDLSDSLSSLLTWPLNIYFSNGFTNYYDWLKDSWKVCILLNTCWMVVGFNKATTKKQTTCLILHEVTNLYKTKCFILWILWLVYEQPIHIQNDNNLGSNSELLYLHF